jgi:hypothetical protein
VTFEQRLYILLRNGFGAALVNALLNGAIGWGLTRGLSDFPVWKAPGVAIDLVLTAFGITFGTCLVLPPQIKRDASRGRITLPDNLPPIVTGLIARLPKGVLARSFLLGAVSVPLFVPPVLVGLAALEGAAMGRLPFVELKALFSAVQGGLVTPLVVLAVLSDYSTLRPANALPSLPAEAP